MAGSIPCSGCRLWVRRATAGAAALALAAASQPAQADEGGVSFWLPGQFGSLAAAPLQPGLSVTEIFYNTNVSAVGDLAPPQKLRRRQAAELDRQP